MKCLDIYIHYMHAHGRDGKYARVLLPEAEADIDGDSGRGLAQRNRTWQLRGGEADDRAEPTPGALSERPHGRPPAARGRAGRPPAHRHHAVAPRRRPERTERSMEDARTSVRTALQTPNGRVADRPRGRSGRRRRFQQHAIGTGHDDERKV